MLGYLGETYLPYQNFLLAHWTSTHLLHKPQKAKPAIGWMEAADLQGHYAVAFGEQLTSQLERDRYLSLYKIVYSSNLTKMFVSDMLNSPWMDNLDDIQ